MQQRISAMQADRSLNQTDRTREPLNLPLLRVQEVKSLAKQLGVTAQVCKFDT